uniref:DNA binding protein n=1 Tax=Micrococcus phage Kurnik TaxID=3092208 RepID=A0AAU6R6V0_9CAUD
MTYMSETKETVTDLCLGCMEDVNIDIITETEDRHVTTTKRCTICGYEETFVNYDDDPDLGAPDMDFYLER